MVAFTNLSSTDAFLGDHSMLIINSSLPLVVLNDNFALPEVPIAPNGTDMAGYILNNAPDGLRWTNVRPKYFPAK